MVSSGIVQSLFDSFIHILERSPEADMNSTVLLISALCGNPESATISTALSPESPATLWAGTGEYPYAMCKKSEAFLAVNQAKNWEIPRGYFRTILTA